MHRLQITSTAQGDSAHILDTSASLLFSAWEEVVTPLPSFIQSTVDTDIFDSNVEKLTGGGHQVAFRVDGRLARYATKCFQVLAKDY